MGYGFPRCSASDALAKLLNDIIAFDESILTYLQSKYDCEDAVTLMRDVADLRKLGYPKNEAIQLAEQLWKDNSKCL